MSRRLTKSPDSGSLRFSSTPPGNERPVTDGLSRRSKGLLVIVVVALLLPQFFTSSWDKAGLPIGLPRVNSGDEPHYLVLINSLVADGDFELENNYHSVHAGSEQAGLYFAGSALDHHTVWPEEGRRVGWEQRFLTDTNKWERAPDGTPVPAIRAGQPDKVPEHEYSSHWPGLAVLLAPVLYPMRGTTYLEPAALVCSWVATVLALACFVSLAGVFSRRSGTIVVAAALVFVGTPVWHYGRTLFTEPYLVACILGAYAALLRRGLPLLSGALVAIAILLKNPAVLFGLPLGIYLLGQRKWSQAARFALFPIVAVGVSLLLNDHTSGSSLEGAQVWQSHSFLTGARGVLFDQSHGIFPYAPILISALAGWPALLRRHRGPALSVAVSILLYGGLVATYYGWSGGYCFGPRHVVPLLPLLGLGLIPRLENPLPGIWPRIDIAILGVTSIVINLLGALPYWKFWGGHPLF